ncbi:DUF1653 domain-containing protein [Alkalibaculum bacchi]|uniref:DUF1653 domain-containing protein n=1 Tax=Alkalibaculum bacchi TaxID=645887 RepID=UPI0026EE1490|nr:DUF1653 domain-containing protein [Alkalibaculum bacchi]
MNTLKINAVYRHFKGKDYLLLYIAQHSETMDDMVVYQALYGERGIWVRPLSMWTEKVEYQGEIVERFRLVEDRNNG